MAKAIKSYAVDLSTVGSATVYTCPANTTAKVLISYLYLKVGGSYNTTSMTIGRHLISITNSNISATREFGSISNIISAASGEHIDTSLGGVEAVFYMSAGQKITASITGTSSVVRAQITILEA